MRRDASFFEGQEPILIFIAKKFPCGRFAGVNQTTGSGGSPLNRLAPHTSRLSDPTNLVLAVTVSHFTSGAADDLSEASHPKPMLCQADCGTHSAHFLRILAFPPPLDTWPRGNLLTSLGNWLIC